MGPILNEINQTLYLFKIDLVLPFYIRPSLFVSNFHPKSLHIIISKTFSK